MIYIYILYVVYTNPPLSTYIYIYIVHSGRRLPSSTTKMPRATATPPLGACRAMRMPSMHTVWCSRKSLFFQQSGRSFSR